MFLIFYCYRTKKIIFNRLSVKKDGPNKGRIFYACPKSNACKFFQWADDVNRQAEQSNTSNSWTTSSTTDNIASGSRGSRNVDLPKGNDTINCNCNKPANSLTVRKEGPNKGRGFYACANRDKSCGFFQWADQNDSQGICFSLIYCEFL